MAYGVILGQTSDSSKDFPVGGIIIWSGQADVIPENWHLCDGTSGTPDLRNRFIVGAGNEYNVGDMGGAKEVTLTAKQMPKHTHNINAGSSGSNSSSLLDVGFRPTISFKTDSAGGNQPHENRPPYYALCYIMKIK